jgi:hypothetical protein
VIVRPLRYIGALAAAALLVGLLASVIAPADGWRGAAAGAGIAFVVQAALVLGLGRVFAGRRLIAAGLAMMGRFVTFAAVALVLILAPGVGLPVAPTLLTLVVVFMVGAVLEPVLGSEPFLGS